MSTESKTKRDRVPGPGFLGFMGQLPLVVGDRLKWLETLQSKYGDIVRVPMGPRAVYAVFHPDYIRHVLVSNAKNYWKGRTFEKTAAYLGKGLATVEGDTWHVQRRRLNPQFHRDSLRSLTPLIVQCVGGMLERWSRETKAGKVIDLSLEFQRMAMEVVARTLFGSEVPEEKITRIIEAFKIALNHTTSRTLNPFDIPEGLPLPSNVRFRNAIALMDEVVYGFIHEEKARIKPAGNLLSILVRAEDPETGARMSDQQVRDEVMTAFLGGTDTSGNTLSWVFYNLHRYPKVKARVLDEIATLGGRTPGQEDLGRFEYMRRMIEETLRLFPQNWVMSRDSYGDDEIGGYFIPGGSTVFMGVYITHRRPDFWTNPETFDPDRFLPENIAGRHNLSYLPFGAGQRKCIGFNFAMMELTVALAMIHQRFEVELLDFEKIYRFATWSLWPKPGMPARLKEK